MYRITLGILSLGLFWIIIGTIYDIQDKKKSQSDPITDLNFDECSEHISDDEKEEL